MEARLKMASTKIEGGKPDQKWEAQKSDQQTKFCSVRVMLNAIYFSGINDAKIVPCCMHQCKINVKLGK